MSPTSLRNLILKQDKQRLTTSATNNQGDVGQGGSTRSSQQLSLPKETKDARNSSPDTYAGRFGNNHNRLHQRKSTTSSAVFTALGTNKRKLQRPSTLTKFSSRPRALHKPTHKRTQRHPTQSYIPPWVAQDTTLKQIRQEPTKPWSSAPPSWARRKLPASELVDLVDTTKQQLACRPGHDVNCLQAS